MTTLQHVINTSRVDINDDDKVRYSDAVLLSYANSYIQEIYKNRPDLLHRVVLNPPITATLLLTSQFPLSDRYIRPCADYIIARAKMRNTEEGSMNEASAYLAISSATSGVR